MHTKVMILMMMEGMKTLRAIVSEVVKQEMERPVLIKECINVTEGPSPGTWALSLVTRGMDGGNTENGFGFSQKAGGAPFEVSSSGIKGFVMKAVIQVHKAWAKPWEPDRLPPFRPVDALVALKHGTATVNGVTITSAPGLQSLVADFIVPRAVKLVGGVKVDIVVTPQSSSRLAAEFGQVLAHHLGAKFVAGGMLKTTDRAEPIDPLPEKLASDVKALKQFFQALERFKKSSDSSLKKGFHTSQRDLVTKWLRPSGDFLDAVMDVEREREVAPRGTKVLIVDDIITTGSSLTEAARELERLGGFEVVGALAMFKMQDSNR